MILIISHNDDDHAVSVMEKLKQRKQNFHLLDLADFPINSELSCSYLDVNRFSMKIKNKFIELNETKVAWWRRPNGITIHKEIQNNEDIQFAFNESYLAISGLWNSLECAWVNNPSFDDVASKKVYQLKLAKEIGFKIPKTLITNSVTELSRFRKKIDGELIYKAFSATQNSWRETRVLQDKDLEKIIDLKYAPVIFQEYIKAKSDLRVTVIGDKIFCAEVIAQKTTYEYDYRVQLTDSIIQEHQLPKRISSQILDFMSTLGLKYGALDFRLTDEKEYIFLEINTSGQWKFIEEKSNLRITDAFVDYLVMLDEENTTNNTKNSMS